MADRQVSLKKKATSAFEKVQDLEQRLEQVAKDANTIAEVVQKLQTQLSGCVEIVNAVVGKLGVDEITELVAQERKKNEELRAKAAQEQLDEAVKQGTITPATTISPAAIIVGQEMDDKGTVKNAHVQLAFQRFTPEFQGKFLGQSVGFEVDLPNNHKFKVTGIYDFVPPKDEPVETK